MQPLSAVIIARNEADRIEDAIRSVQFADEVLVVDSGSDDETVQRAEALGARVIQTDWPGHVAQKQRAMNWARHDWVLSLDADERVSQTLAAAVRTVLSSSPAVYGFWVNRRNHYLGRRLRAGGWYPDRRLRLVRRGRARWVGTDPHDWLVVDGDTGRLSGDLDHHPYRDLSEHLATLDRYSKRFVEVTDRRAHVWDVLFRPIWAFLRGYVFLAGFIDGVRGLMVAGLSAFHVGLKWGRLYLSQHSRDSKQNFESPLTFPEREHLAVALVLRRYRIGGGTGGYAVNLTKALIEAGHVVHVLCIECSSDEDLPSAEEGLILHRLSVPRLGGMWTMLLFAAVARRRLKRILPDVAIGLGRVPGLEIYRAGGGCHDAYLDTVPGWWLSIRQHVERWIDRASVLSARRVIANAPRPRSELVSRYGADPDRVVVIPNGVDTGRFRPNIDACEQVRQALQVTPDHRLVVFLGSGFVRKGLDRALETVAELERVVLVVVGGDGRQARYEALAKRLGVKAHFVGASSDPERYLAAADLMLLPTRYDAAANAVLEAMACGVPVVTTATNGAHAFLPETWMTADSAEDVAGLVHASQRALDTQGLGERCRAVAEEMTPQKNRDAVLAVVEGLRGAG